MTPQQKSTIENTAKGILAAVALLTGVGYVVQSPKEQVEQLARRFEQVITAQHATDSLQNAHIEELKSKTDTGLRSVSEDVRDLIIAECLRANDRAVFARLNCRTRLGK
jgi:SPX domain protein involved in polyphosphate accumulation